MTPEQYDEFTSAVEKQRKVVARKQKIVDRERDILSSLLTECPHSEIISEKSYSEGSYYDKASIKRWNRCIVCNKTSTGVVEQLSYYG